MKASSLRLLETPIAIIDLETTGLSPAGDRIVEVSVIRVGASGEIEAEFDTLVNPRRRVTGTEIHGITDRDVKDAPAFADIVSDIQKLCAGAFVTAYNVYFDSKFLEEEFRLAGKTFYYPYFCLMYMRPLLGIGKRCNLHEACRQHQLEIFDAHTAYGDAAAGAALWKLYRAKIHGSPLNTFGDLRALAKYKFFQTFDYDCTEATYEGGAFSACVKSRRRSPSSLPFRCELEDLAAPLPPKPRSATSRTTAEDPPRRPNPVAEYFDALTAFLSDLHLDEDELALLQGLQRQLELSQEQIRWAHSRFFIGILSEFGSDAKIDDTEDAAINLIFGALAQLGYAPGHRPRGFLGRLFS